MSKADRMPRRNPRVAYRNEMPGYYYIVTDTKETEKNYINGLHDSLPEEIRNRIIIKTLTERTDKLLQKCDEIASEKLEAQYRKIWIVFDRDEVQGFDEIVDVATRVKGYGVGWSNPCIEAWFCAYFGKMPQCDNSKKCVGKFGEMYKNKTNREYHKNDEKIYEILSNFGDERRAIEIAKNRLRGYKDEYEDGKDKMKPPEIFPASTLYELVEEIRHKAELRPEDM